jgi:hypothetical protein
MTVIAAPITDFFPADTAPAEMTSTAAEPGLLPEVEWCPFCSYDETSGPGMPRDIVECTVESALPPEDWDPRWGQGPQYETTYLSCGHVLAKLC